MSQQYDHLLKLLIVGDSDVGKSSLLLRFVDDSFEENLAPTVGVDFRVKLFDTEHAGRVKLTLWDTAGQERFRTLTSSYYRGAQGVILVYDVTRRDSFDHVQHWLNEVEAHLSGSQVVKLLVGNKIDKHRLVDRAQAEAWARSHQMLFVETSARENLGVTAAFSEVVNKILESPTLLSSAKVTGARRQLKDSRLPHESSGNCAC